MTPPPALSPKQQQLWRDRPALRPHLERLAAPPPKDLRLARASYQRDEATALSCVRNQGKPDLRAQGCCGAGAMAKHVCALYGLVHVSRCQGCDEFAPP